MQPRWTIRVLTMDDYEALHALWMGVDGLGLSAADSRQGIQQILERNPGLSCVAEADGRLVGSALCGHDGRRGYLYHLAVHSEVRGQGIGAALVRACLDELARRGIDKCHAYVYGDNETGCDFWRHIRAEQREELEIFSMLTPKTR